MKGAFPGGGVGTKWQLWLRETTSNVDMKHIGSERHCPLIPSTSLIDRGLFWVIPSYVLYVPSVLLQNKGFKCVRVQYYSACQQYPWTTCENFQLPLVIVQIQSAQNTYETSVVSSTTSDTSSYFN